MASTTTRSTGNPALDHPGITATILTLAVLFGFLFLLYQAATDHSAPHGGAHGGAHGGGAASAPAAHH